MHGRAFRPPSGVCLRRRRLRHGWIRPAGTGVRVKLLVVQGEGGFWRLLTPETLERFLWTGWYGVGEGGVDGLQQLSTQLKPLLQNSAQRARLGHFGRSLVVSKFSLEVAANGKSSFTSLRWPRRLTLSRAYAEALLRQCVSVVSPRDNSSVGAAEPDAWMISIHSQRSIAPIGFAHDRTLRRVAPVGRYSCIAQECRGTLRRAPTGTWWRSSAEPFPSCGSTPQFRSIVRVSPRCGRG